MRTAFFKTLLEIAETDPRINLVVGDLGFGVVEPFVQRFPDRFLNVGVAEQNMTGVAAGMALSGKTVFTYSIANFPTLRCLEQIRNDICYHRADVKIVAVGGGFMYGALGMTHHATEDLAIMRALPEMTVVAPGDPLEAAHATRALAATPGPAYLRLGRAGEPAVHQGPIDFRIGRAIMLRDGADLTLIASGGMLDITVKAADRLESHGVRTRVLSMHTVKPLDEQAILSAADETGAVVTIEEHSILGGLGGAAAEVLAESGISPLRFKRIGLPSEFADDVGGQNYLRTRYGLTEPAIVQEVLSLLDSGAGARRRYA
jgi:transketolase